MHQYTKFTHKWSARNAFYQLNREEVKTRAMEVSGHAPGHPAYLGCLQDATTYLWKELTSQDQDDYIKAAKEWSEDALREHIQSR